jgi:hypothetical protein
VSRYSMNKEVTLTMIKIIIIFSLIFSFQVNAVLAIKKSKLGEDLASYTVTNQNSQFSFKVYFDNELEEVASQSIPILNDLYSNLASNAGLQPSNITWAEVAFVTDEDYIPPRKNGAVRWKIVHEKSQTLSRSAIEAFYVFIGHEQTHSIQNVLSCKSPRWFGEGQAMWNELKVTKVWDNQIAIKERSRYETAYENLEDDLNLDSWGEIQVKPEAIQRQLTPEQKQKMKEDPSYSPPGPFGFGPDDLISDESNSDARYFTSLTIFEYLEKELGMENLELLFNNIYQMKNCESDSLQEFIRTEYKLDISNFFDQST